MQGGLKQVAKPFAEAIGPTGASALADALKVCLRSLLTFNKQVNQTLKTFRLSDVIYPPTHVAFAQAIKVRFV